VIEYPWGPPSFLTRETETKFHVKPLPHARIPIVKLSLDPSPGLPLGIACDIGFENRLALENTRLLMCYAMVDPTRVRTMVLFRASSRPLLPKFSQSINPAQSRCGVNGGNSPESYAIKTRSSNNLEKSTLPTKERSRRMDMYCLLSISLYTSRTLQCCRISNKCRRCVRYRK